jgi:hypothetical protein
VHSGVHNQAMQFLRRFLFRYAVYQYRYQSRSFALGSTTILLHVTPYGPSITDVMPYYTVLEYETSFDRRDKWSEFVSKVNCVNVFCSDRCEIISHFASNH